MTFSTQPRTRRARLRRSALIAATALSVGASLALPLSASAALNDNGGAQRNDGNQTAALRASIVDGPAKNVILLIGDGMGDSEITIARNYAYGAAGELPGIDALPITGQYTTYSLHNEGPERGLPDYVPDSAATGSAWATGTKTYDNAISVDIDGAPQQTLLEIAKANGLKTGNVSTAEIQDATPAVQVAHVDARSCYGPDSVTCGDNALIAGGLGSISEQLIGTRPDVTLGGGSASFTQTAKAGDYIGQTLFEQATNRGYQLVADGAELAAVTTADQTQPVLGLFTEGNFPTRYAATPATLLGADSAPITCTENPDRLPTDLSLATLTNKAIDLLDTSDAGFFLQVEGASIDKQDHAANACGQIGETLDLDEAVQAALAFAESDGDTLVIVTADHAHTSQIVDGTPLTTLSAALTTADGSTMKVAYGTNTEEGGSQQHTGTQLRIAAYGPGAANVAGLTDQTDNFFTMANALELNRDTASLSAAASVTLSVPSVTPGSTVVATGAGFAGDRQVGGTVGSTALASTDAIGGAASFEFTAPTEPGDYTVTLTGAQSGVAATATLTVALVPVVDPTPSTSPSPVSPSPSSSAIAVPGGGGNGLDLPTTGAAIGSLGLIAASMLALGSILVARRRRAHSL